LSISRRSGSSTKNDAVTISAMSASRTRPALRQRRPGARRRGRKRSRRPPDRGARGRSSAGRGRGWALAAPCPGQPNGTERGPAGVPVSQATGLLALNRSHHQEEGGMAVHVSRFCLLVGTVIVAVLACTPAPTAEPLRPASSATDELRWHLDQILAIVQ